MPGSVSKPVALMRDGYTIRNKAERERAERELCVGEIPQRPPKQISGSKLACDVWRRVTRDLRKMPRWVWSRLDVDELCDYCTVMADIQALTALRNQRYQQMQAATSPEELLAYQRAAESVNRQLTQLKRLAHEIRGALYMTPRSRAGVVPDVDESAAEDVQIQELFE